MKLHKSIIRKVGSPSGSYFKDTSSMSTERIHEVLREVFGFRTLRPLQEECITAVLNKQDAFLIMPTGGGKSLCYQLPALLFEGMTVVVSPLIALMQDQVSQLQALGIEADLLNSALSWQEYQENMRRIQSGRTKILYLAPETLFKEEILAMLSRVGVDCLAIDEAHCISEWGHDFRPEYRQLAEIRTHLPETVFLAMTATATLRVRDDIKKNLGLREPLELVGSFNRINLFYEVLAKQKPFIQVTDFLKRFAGQSGIIYCFSRRQVDELTYDLNHHGYQALPYHAGLSDDMRARHHEAFIRDDAAIMIATIAFGMGINKPNVRFVIHYDLPRNLESYYQETGRAGRDGIPSHCLLLFSYGDINKIKYLIRQKLDDQQRRISLQHLQAIVAYAEARGCRRLPLLRYFNEDYQETQCGLCDNCFRPKVADFDMTVAAKQCLAVMLRTGNRFGAKHVIDVLRGDITQKVQQYEHQELDVFGIGKDFSAREWQDLLRQFIEQGLIHKQEDAYGVLKVTDKAKPVWQGQMQVMGFAPLVPKPKAAVVKLAPPTREEPIGSEQYDQKLFAVLRRKRKELADQHNVPPYIIFSDRTLIEMSRYLPQTREALAQIYGIGAKKMESFGKIFLKVIREYIDGMEKNP
jgi:ATP-dependent DNA helicase RecQ